MLRRFGDEAGVLDVADDLDLVHAVAAPAARTTFSSIITLPMSLAPKARLSCPTLPPCVTHDDWRLSKLSRTSRAIASVRRYSIAGGLAAAELGVLGLVAPGDERGEAARLVLQLAQPEQVLEPLLDGLHVPYIMVAVVRSPARGRGASRRAIRRRSPCCSSSGACARDRRGSRRRRRDAVEAGGDQPLDHLRTGSCDSRDRWITSGGDSACSLNAGYRAFTARNRSSYHSSGRSGCGRPAAGAGRRRGRWSRRSCRKISSNPST